MTRKRVDKGVPSMDLLVCRNPSAVQRYEIEERFEAGLVLMGSEVKSLRERRGDLEGAYAQVVGDEVFLQKMHIAPYVNAGVWGHEPKRTRKLLLHRREIERLRGRVSEKGYTLVPLQVYFKNGHAKVELGLGRGKKRGDDRESIKKKIDLDEARAAMSRTRGR